MADPTMDAVRIESFGGPEKLQLQQVPIPVPGTREVLLRVQAASVNPVDYKIRSGKYQAVKEDKLPYTLGRDVCGIVEVSKSERFGKGDSLYGVPGIERGGYAQYVVLKEGEAAHKPKTLDAITAAAVPLAGLTAWQGLFRYGELRAGQRVLIHAGSGGVGHFAIQFAKAKGAHVITTVSSDHVDFALALGADEVIDYKTQKFENEVSGVDMVFDLIDGETRDKSWAVLKKGGILVSTLTAPSPEKAAEFGVRATRFTVTETGSELDEIGTLIDGGKVKPKVSKTFPLADAASAHRLIEEGHTEGKIVLTVA
jgi:NADPH:quinone reductase-like Zn-dependent oxidoreductase